MVQRLASSKSIATNLSAHERSSPVEKIKDRRGVRGTWYTAATNKLHTIEGRPIAHRRCIAHNRLEKGQGSRAEVDAVAAVAAAEQSVARAKYAVPFAPRGSLLLRRGILRNRCRLTRKEKMKQPD